MLLLDRQQQILDILNERRSVTVDTLCKMLYASAATVRRDLSEMEAKNMLTRVRGGAVLLDGPNKDKPLLMRAQQNFEKKEAIAHLALAHVSDSATIFMDSSSTVTSFARLLGPLRNLSIMTNGLDTINVLNEVTSAKIFDTGGVLKDNFSVVGSLTIAALESFHADILFFSCCGLSLACGTTEASEDSAAVKKAMCENAKVRILLCDSTKFGQEFFCKVCSLDSIAYVVTEKKPSETFCKALGTRLVYGRA